MELSRHQCGALTLVQVQLKDRRTRAARDERFLFQHHVEEALYGACTGALYRLLARCSLSQAPLLLKAASVGEGLVTRAEYDFLIRTFEEGLPLESQGRVRGWRCTVRARWAYNGPTHATRAHRRSLLWCERAPSWDDGAARRAFEAGASSILH